MSSFKKLFFGLVLALSAIAAQAQISGDIYPKYCPDRSAASPCFSFANNTTMGFYRAGNNRMGVAVGGVQIGEFNSTGYVGLAGFSLANGTAGSPSLFFTNSPTTGWYRAAADQIGTSIAGVNVGTWTSTGLRFANLTNLRFPLVGASGLLTDSASFTYSDDASNRLFSIAGSSSNMGYQVTNSGTGTALLFLNGGTGGGDAYVKFNTQSGGSTNWALGSDDSAANAFVLSEASTLGTSNRISVAKGGAVTIGGDVTAGGAFLADSTGGKAVALSLTGGLVYQSGLGIGGTVVQGAGSGKATAVTLDKLSGSITMDNALLAAGAIVSFVWNNATINGATTDFIMCSHRVTGTLGAYTVNCRPTGAGAAEVNVRNNTAGGLSEAIVIKFMVLRAPQT